MADRATDMEIAAAVDDRDMARADALERIRIQAGIADAALKSVILVNGGAIVALFTFIGNAQKGVRLALDTGSIWKAFLVFVVGLIAGLIAPLFSFLSQSRFYAGSMKEFWRAQRVVHEGERPVGTTPEELDIFRRGQAFFIFAIVLAVASVACFAIGSWFALAGVLPG